MGPAHARVRGMGMTDEHFDIVKNTLAFTIKEDFGFTDEQVAQAAEVVESTREQACNCTRHERAMQHCLLPCELRPVSDLPARSKNTKVKEHEASQFKLTIMA